MTLVAIELNDAGILTAGEPPLEIEPSPGYALIEGKELQLGSEALSRARLKPRWVDNRFWQALDSSPLPKPFPRSLSRADLAHDHLRSVWDRIRQQVGAADAEVLLAIPGSFSLAQLGLVLGIARACEIPVTGMVDSAVAAAAAHSVGSRILHLDATLHRMIWTELTHDDELQRRRVEVLETGGLLAVRDGWAKRIAELLVRRTRFDPFHHGRAEQTLYDRLPQWMEQLTADGRVLITLETEGKEYAVELSGEEVANVAGAVTEPVVELARALAGSEEPATLMVSARVAAIPGLVARLQALTETAVIELPAFAAVEGTLQQRERIAATGGELPFVVRLPAERRSSPRRETPTPPPTYVASAGRKSLPTHVLLGGVAHPVGSEPLWLGSAAGAAGERSLDVGGSLPGLSRRHCSIRRRGEAVIVEDHSTYGTYLNERRIEGRQTLRPGDRLRIGSPGVELQMIRVVEDDV